MGARRVRVRTRDGRLLCVRRLRRPGAARAVGDRYRRGRRPADGLLPAHLEGELGPVRVADVDVQTVMDVDGRHPAAVDEHAVETAVVDGDPPALIEAQDEVCAGDQWVCDANVGAEIATDDDIVASGEGTC